MTIQSRLAKAEKQAGLTGAAKYGDPWVLYSNELKLLAVGSAAGVNKSPTIADVQKLPARKVYIGIDMDKV